MPNPETILEWLKEAGANAFQREETELLTIFFHLRTKRPCTIQ
jgi:hypothetical protein